MKPPSLPRHPWASHLPTLVAQSLCLLTALLLPNAARALAPDEVPTGLAKSDWSGIKAAYDAGRHAIRNTENGFTAPNPTLGWHITWDQSGFLASPTDTTISSWQWGLSLSHYGFQGAEQAISGTPATHADGPHLTYQWNDHLTEWYQNDTRGLEHGFTVAQRPPTKDPSDQSDSSDLSFTLTVRGGLLPAISPDAQTVRFLNASGTTIVTYSGLKVWDADGKILPSHFAAADSPADTFRLLVDERGARYPITIDPLAQQAYLKASNAEAGDFFGSSVAVSGDTVVVGSPYEDSISTGVNSIPNDAAEWSGAAYVFVRNGAGAWSQQAYLKASNTDAMDQFGSSVAISGDTIVIGALDEDSKATGVNGVQSDDSFHDAGAAYVFTRPAGGTTWTQQAYLKASNTYGSIYSGGDHFGTSVAISGDTIVVGAYGERSNATGVNAPLSGGSGTQSDKSSHLAGAAYVFTRPFGGSAWTQQAYLKASNTGWEDYFGWSVAISADTIVVGARSEDSSATGVNGEQSDDSTYTSGAAYVFTRPFGGTAWTQQAYLKASNTGYLDSFGYSVAISGDTIIVGASFEESNAIGVNAPPTGGPGTQSDNSKVASGAAYVFTRPAGGTTWTQQAYLKASNPDQGDQFGHSVAISGNTVVVGAYGEDSNATGVDAPSAGGSGTQSDNSMVSAGAAYVFTRPAGGTTWTQQAYLKNQNTNSWDYNDYQDSFGKSVAIFDNTIVVGAPDEDSSTTGINSTPDGSAIAAGAAYTFHFPRAIPQISTRPATTITATTATLNCRAFPNYSATTVQYEWGESPSGTLTTITIPGTFSGSAPVFPTHTLTGLLPGRAYRFRARASNSLGAAPLDSFLTFTTAPAAPTLTTLAATSVTSTSAVLNGTVRANGAPADVWFRYFSPGVEGFNATASPSLITGTTTTPVSATVTGLLPGTQYTFAVRASNASGDGSWGNLTFTTLPDPAVGGLAEPLTVPVTGGALYGSLIQPDGRTILFGDFTSVHGTALGRMARLLANGSLEGGLGFNPGANGPITCAALLADGKIMIGGNFTTLQPRGTGPVFPRSRLARLLPDGTVDTTFGDPGVNAFVLCMAVQPDGAVLVGGDFNSPASFMGATRNRIARITPAGTLDNTFNPNADAPVYSIAVQPDGKVLLAGSFGSLSGQGRLRIARVNSITGAPEPGFGAGSGPGNLVFSMALQRDGRVIIGGTFTSVSGTPMNHLARLNSDGTLDTTFNPNVTGGDVLSIALQANLKLLIGGSFTSVGGTPRNKVARVDTTGVLDGFNPNVTGGDVLSIALQADGKAQLAGTFTAINGGAAARSGFALLNNETAYQTLEKRSATELFWSRGGSAPEVLSVTFDQATFLGSTFTPIGNGTRVDPLAGDWRLTSISPTLPLSAQIRVRARTASGYLSGSTGIMESKVSYIHSLPVVTSVSVTEITGTSALLTGTVDTSTLTASPAFKLDTTTAYTQPLRIASPATTTGTATFTHRVTGLAPGTAYVFRATAENPGGRTDGTDIPFSTLTNLHVDYKADGSDNAPTATTFTASGRQVSFSLARHLDPGTTLMVVNNTGTAPITGTFSNLAQGQPVDLTFGSVTYPYVAHYYGGNGNDLVLLWRHTRALSWGWNNLGQLGNTTSTNKGIPGDVFASGPLAGKTFVSLSGGTQHSVALCVDGSIATWGDNREGQLGNGDPITTSSTVPTTVDQGFLPDGIHPVAISAGGSHTLSLFSDGKVYAWGDNQFGQLGSNDAPSDHPLPIPAAGALSGRRVIGISAGEFHSLAVCDDGFVAAWGLGTSGQLGNGDTANHDDPQPVDLSDLPAGEKFVAVAAGRSHSMALTSGGKVFTWGRNTEGQLGIGTTSNSKYPVLVPDLTASAILGGGTMHSLAIRTDGKLMAWGTSTFGQLGTPLLSISRTPVVVRNTWFSDQDLPTVTSGDQHNLALQTDGTLLAWGLGNEGRLGNNVTRIHIQPVQLPVNTTALDPGDRWQGLFSGAACQHSLAIVAMSLLPAATTDTAIPLGATEAYLLGTVNPHGQPVDVTFDYGLTTEYGTTVTASPATMNGTVRTFAEAAITGLLPGTTYHYQVKAVHGGISFALGGDRTFTTFTRLQMWRNDNFGSIESTDAAADNADPDNDGVANLTEFAFGLNPLRPDAAALPQHVVDGSLILLEFTEPLSHMGITYSAEWSPDMSPGSWSALPDKGAGPVHSFKFSTAGSERGFLRLKATVTSP
jgi:uncharacterized delta-60 repeat protein